MATRLIDTTGCNSDYIVTLSVPYTGAFLTVLTIQDNGSNPSFYASNSLIISTLSGYSFYGGGNSEYIRRSGDSLTFISMSSNWILLNTFAYTTAGYALLPKVSTTNFFGLGSASLSTLMIKENLTSVHLDLQILPTVQEIPVISQSNLNSTVAGLGSLGYFSSVEAMGSIFASTVDGLSGYTFGYISSTQIQSTVAGLGSVYVSTGALTSTMDGLGSVYVSSSGLISTVAGLGTIGYISSTRLASTVEGLGSFGYISTAQVISTVSSVLSVTGSNCASTFINVGSLYISRPSLVSTVRGASNTYINSNQFASTTLGVTYYFTGPIISTVAGLGSMYVSTFSLYSTVEGVFAYNQSNVSKQISSLGSIYVSSLSLQSTVDGLGMRFISLSQLTSTTTGVSFQSQSNMNSTIDGLGQIYISTTQFFSTAVGLSNLAEYSIFSTLAGLGTFYISSLSLQSTVAGLGTYRYISLSQLTSTTSNIIASVGNSLPSTLAGLGTSGYISFAQTISTVTGISAINESNLISTVNTLGQMYVSSATLQSTVAGLGNLYISLPQLISTTSNVLILGSNFIQSTFVGLATAGYISLSQTVSTVTSFSNRNLSNLISTVNTLGQMYVSSATLQSTVAGLGNLYISLPQLISTTSNVLILGSNFIQSSFVGLGTAGYISLSQTVSTVTSFSNRNLSNLISTVNTLGQMYVSSATLQSTVAGLGNLYISLPQLISTTSNVLVLGSNFIQSTFVGLGTAGYISHPHIISTVVGLSNLNRSNLISTVNTLGSLYMSSRSLQSTVAGLGNSYVSLSELTSTTYSVVILASEFIQSTLIGMSNVGYVSQSQLSSTLIGLRQYNASNFISTANSLGQTYISSLSLRSTVAGLGRFGYVSVSQLTSTTIGIQVYDSNTINARVAILGSLTYISASQLISTVRGIQSNDLLSFMSTVETLGRNYISSPSLVSTVTNLGTLNFVTGGQMDAATNQVNDPAFINLQAQVDPLVTGLHLTILENASTTVGIASNTQSNVISTVNRLGTMYISAPSVRSTVAGLGTYGYVSLSQIISTASTLVGMSSCNLVSTYIGLGNYYISSPHLISSVGGFTLSNSIILPSTVAGLGSVYVSSLSLQSTVSGLGTFYMSTAQLTSTTLGLFSNSATLPSGLVSSASGLGRQYVSSLSLQSTVAGLGSIYISAPNLVSTVVGLGSFGYLSTSYLTSTVTGYSNPMPQIISTVVGLGQIYISSASGTPINPDQYRTQTKFTGRPILSLAFAGSTLFFADSSNIYSNAISSLSTGEPTVFVSLANANGMSSDGTNLYVSQSNMLVSYAISSKARTVIANTNNTPGFTNSSGSNIQPLASTATFRSIQGICIDSTNTYVYVCDLGNNALRRIQLSPFSVNTVAVVNNPYAVAVDSNSQYAYVTSSQGIVKVCLFQPNISLLTSEGVNSRGIWIDPSGTLAYVTSQINSYILEVNLSTGSTSTLAGTPGSVGFVDGTSALFYNPCAIVYSYTDTCIYVADTANRAIRQILSKIYYSTIQGLTVQARGNGINVKVPMINGVATNCIARQSLQLWLDAADPTDSNTTNIAPVNGSLFTWRDKSRNSNHALPVNSVVYSNGYILLNTNSYLVSPYMMNSSQHHAFIVFQYPTSGSFNLSLLSGTSNGEMMIYLYNNTIVLGSPYNSQNHVNGLPSNIPVVAEIITTATSSTIYINGGSATNGSGYIYGNSITQIGGNAVTPMYMCEVLVYNTFLSSAERTTINNYLFAKWVTPSSNVIVAVQNSNTVINASNSTIIASNALNASYVIQPGLSLWLDGADPTGTGVLSVGSNLTVWVDKSGISGNSEGVGTVTANGISLTNSFFTTSVQANLANSTTFIVFSNATTGIVPLIGASQGSNVGYEILLSNRNILLDLSYPENYTNTFGVEALTFTGGGTISNTFINRVHTINTVPYFIYNTTSDYITVGETPVVFPVCLTRSSTGNITIAQARPVQFLILNEDGSSIASTAFFNAYAQGELSDIAYSKVGYIICSYASATIYFLNISGFLQIKFANDWGDNTYDYVISIATNSAYKLSPDSTICTVSIGRQVGGANAAKNRFNLFITSVEDGFTLTKKARWYVGFLGNRTERYAFYSHICFDPSSFNGNGLGDYYYTLNNQVWRLTISSITSSGVIFNHGCIANTYNFAALIDSPNAFESGAFNTLVGIACDLSGNIYVSDYYNQRIRMLYKNSDGTYGVTTIFDFERGGPSSRPTTMTYTIVSGIGYLYVIYLTYNPNASAVDTFPLDRNFNIPNLLKLRITPVVLTTSTTFNTTNNHLFNYTNTNGLMYGYSDNSLDTSINGASRLATFGTPGTLNLGLYYNPSPVYFTGSIQEVIIYTTSLTPTQRTNIQTYLYNKWVPSYTNRPLLALIPFPATTRPVQSIITPPKLVGPTTVPTTTAITVGSAITITGNLYAGNITAATFRAVSASGNGYYFGDGTYVTNISDQRLKEDIRPIENALAKVSSMQAVRYRMYSDPSQRWIGYIAQDLEVILPEVVRTDAEGWKSIQYTNLPALIIEAVKELKEKYGQIRLLLSSSGNPI